MIENSLSLKDIFTILSEDSALQYFNDLCIIHKYTKHYLLLAEEISGEGAAFLQPLKEHRDAYDHLVRIFSLSNKNLSYKDSKEYAISNLKKAFGHEYRAFFDTMDWLTFICRKYVCDYFSVEINKKRYLDKYDDFETIKSFINELPFVIAKYRDDKDVGAKNLILQEVLDYKETVDTLIDIYRKIQLL